MERGDVDGLRNLGVVWIYVVAVGGAVEAFEAANVTGAALVVSSSVAAVAFAVVVLLAYDRFVLGST